MARIMMSEDPHGVFLEATNGNLTTSCLSEGEIKSDLVALRSEIDAMERKMIARVKARAKEPIFNA